MDLDFAIRHSHGVMRTELLLRCGLTKHDIRQRVADGLLIPLRRGWYAVATHDPVVASAVRAGGVLSCVSALAMHRIWTPLDARIHLRSTRHGRDVGRSAPQGPAWADCGRHLSRMRPATAVDPLLAALSAAADCVDGEELVAIVDSMLHQRRCSLEDIRAALADRSVRVRRLLEYVDARAESGTESIVRYRLAQHNIRAEPQVQIAGVGRVDLLVGDRLVIECDSRSYHTDDPAYENDRARDRRLLARHDRICVRVTYRQTFYDWDEALADILALVRRRAHYFPRRRGTR